MVIVFLPLMNGVVLNLPQNQKGHYMLDVVEYLTDGLRNSKGHAAVHVMLEEPAEKPEVINDHSIEFFPVQFSDVFVSENASVDGKFSSYRRSRLPFARPQTLQTLQKSAQLRRKRYPNKPNTRHSRTQKPPQGHSNG